MGVMLVSGPTLAPLFGWRQALVHPASPLSHHAITTGEHLSLYMNSYNFTAWPSQERLAAELRRSVRAIQRDINELRRCGYLRVERRKGTSNIYHLSLPPDMAHLYAMSVTPPGTRKGHPVIPQMGDTTPESGDHTTPESSKTQEELVTPAEKTPKGDHRALFGALCEVMGRPPQGGEGAVWGRVAKLMAQELVPPAEVVRRGAAMKARWTTIPPSPMALWNNWGQFAEGQREVSPYERRAQGERDIHELAEDLRRRGEA